MTVYTGDIKAAIGFLAAQIAATPDFDQLSATDKATLQLAAQQLQDRLSGAIAALDADTAPGGLSGPPLAPSGAFPLDTAAALLAAIANSEQQATLIALKGFTGRLQLNLGAAG
jgi:hypothetical protein